MNKEEIKVGSLVRLNSGLYSNITHHETTPSFATVGIVTAADQQLLEGAGWLRESQKSAIYFTVYWTDSGTFSSYYMAKDLELIP